MVCLYNHPYQKLRFFFIAGECIGGHGYDDVYFISGVIVENVGGGTKLKLPH